MEHPVLTSFLNSSLIFEWGYDVLYNFENNVGVLLVATTWVNAICDREIHVNNVFAVRQSCF